MLHCKALLGREQPGLRRWISPRFYRWFNIPVTVAEWLQWLVCPLPTGRRWLRLDSNLIGSVGGVPDHAKSLTVRYPGFKSLTVRCRGIKWTRDNLQLARHAAYEYGGWVNKECDWFKLSHVKTGWPKLEGWQNNKRNFTFPLLV